MSFKLVTRSLAGVVLFLPLLLFQGGLVQANAAEYVCGNRGPYHDGFFHDNGSNPQRFEGASAYIVTRWGGLCGTDQDRISNFTNSWSMIAAGDGCGWAQSGFERGYVAGGGNNIRHFTQLYECGGSIETRYWSGDVDVRHAYRSLYTPSCGCIESSVDGGVVFRRTWFNPYANWAYPFIPQFAGEAAYRESDMPGYPVAHTDFTALGAQRVSDDVLVQMPCTMVGTNDNPTEWGRSAAGCDAFDVWTK